MSRCEPMNTLSVPPGGSSQNTWPRAAVTFPKLGSPLVVLAARTGLFLGKNLLAYLVLALGGALFVGNGLALVRPPERPKEGELRRAPIGRTLLMMSVGGLAALWALASLVS
jgi:hypothetical protein